MKAEDKKRVRTFGWGLVILFAFFGTLRLIFKDSSIIPWQYYVSAAALILNLTFPLAIYPIYKGAIFIAHYLGWFNTRLLLGIIYFLVFTPIAFIFKIMGKDLLDRKIDRNAESYWNKREPSEFNPSDVENQF